MVEASADTRRGRLYVVATPIGNLKDITLRAIETLGRVDLIAAEDTRHTRRLLSAHHIRNRMVSYHEHNERHRTAELIDKLEGGASIALVTDAGTPAVSDPGYRIVAEAVRRNIRVVPIPGASSAITALSVSGLAAHQFTFIGFAPRKKSRRLAQLETWARLPHTLIFYESPKRLTTFLEELKAVMGDRLAVLAREQTKLHEEFIRSPLSEIIKRLSQRPTVKGECTLLVSGAVPSEADQAAIESALDAAMADQNRPTGDIAKSLARQFGRSRKEMYDLVLQRKGSSGDDL